MTLPIVTHYTAFQESRCLHISTCVRLLLLPVFTDFDKHYCDPDDCVKGNGSLNATNSNCTSNVDPEDPCAREISLLYLLLLLGTLWLGVTLFKFKETWVDCIQLLFSVMTWSCRKILKENRDYWYNLKNPKKKKYQLQVTILNHYNLIF